MENNQVAQPPAAQTANRELSFGEQLVGLTFNPSQDPQVDRVKKICAELADIVRGQVEGASIETLGLRSTLYFHSLGEILNAQMNVVKLLTLKY